MPQSIIGLQLIANAKVLEDAAELVVAHIRRIEANEDLEPEGKRWLIQQARSELDAALDRAITLKLRASSPEASMEASV